MVFNTKPTHSLLVSSHGHFMYILLFINLLLCLPTGAVIGVRAMLCMSLMSGLVGWAVGMVALIAHKSRFLFTVALAFGIQGNNL